MVIDRIEYLKIANGAQSWENILYDPCAGVSLSSETNFPMARK